MLGCISIIGNIMGFSSTLDHSNSEKPAAIFELFHSDAVVHSMTMKSFMCGSAVISLRMSTMIVIYELCASSIMTICIHLLLHTFDQYD
jgi:hypothetical protein